MEPNQTGQAATDAAEGKADAPAARQIITKAPTFLTRLYETWSSSLTALRQFGEELVLIFVAVLPWLPLLAALPYVGYRAVRWLARRLQQMTQNRVLQPPVVHQ